jgi:DNA-directed RNA polymerase subunit M/transcription elongation factor TFIIS
MSSQPHTEKYKDIINFCENCSNIMYTYIDEKDKLFNGCKVCLTVKEASIDKLKTTKEKIDISTIINRNPYLLDDNTLSVTENQKNISCPNEDCKTNTSSEKFSFISYKYNVDELKFLYKCTNCNHSWTNI